MGGICPVGHYCPTGTTTPIPCGAGAFSNVTGLSTCHQCPAGYYCLLGADNYQATPCDPGYYCPAGTTSATQYPCPAGTFYNLTMATTLSDCLPCPGGEYCATPGLSTPTGKCSPGIWGKNCFYLKKKNFKYIDSITIKWFYEKPNKPNKQLCNVI